jgi:hypothetical protein
MITLLKLKPYFLFILISSIPSFLMGQNGHYWTQQYGTRSMLLSGSAIGGVSDLGAIYYNPARLAQIDNPAFLLSADVFELNTITVEDAFGDGANTSKSDFGSVPSLAAGTFKLSFLKNHNFAWAILQRYDANNSFSFKDEVQGNLFENLPGEEYFNAELRIDNKLKEQWTGFTWSYSINEKLSVGVSTFLSVIKQGKGSFIDLQALTEDSLVAIYRFNKSFSLTHYRMIWKMGVSYQIKKATIGLTVLVPPVKLGGSGSYQNEEFFSGIDSVTTTPDTYTTSFQKNIDTKYKAPIAIGLGITVPVNKSKIHVSAEYYGSVPEYTLIQADPHVSQSSGDTLTFQLYDKLNSVINYGIGFELFLSEKVSAYASFSADHSAAGGNISLLISEETRVSNSSIKADYYHFGGGVVLTLKGADITVGGTYTGSKTKFTRPFNFPDDSEDDIFDPDEQSTLKWSRWRFVFSFSLPFLKDKTKAIEQKLGL